MLPQEQPVDIDLLLDLEDTTGCASDWLQRIGCDQTFQAHSIIQPLSRNTSMSAHKSQDKGLTVLSMHQPWASLLVYGLKRIEGRGWPTEHTGRLWIHSTSKSATPQEIQVHAFQKDNSSPSVRHLCLLQEMQDFYVTLHQSEGTDITPNLPPHYPTSVLLGCVDVVSCQPVSNYTSLTSNLHVVAVPCCVELQASSVQ